MSVESTSTLEHVGQDTYHNLVTFRLGQQIYALPIEPVVQIVEMVTITPIPRTNPSVEGVINYHGKSVPVLNLRRHLGLPAVPFGLYTHIIIAQTDDKTIGLIVDQVLSVLDLDETQLAHPDDILPTGLGAASTLEGLAHTADGTVLVLCLEKLFSDEHVGALGRALDTLPADKAHPGNGHERAGSPRPYEELAQAPSVVEIEQETSV